MAYLDLAGDEWLTLGVDELQDGTGIRAWSTHQRAECLRRAIRISRELNDEPLIEGVTAVLLARGGEAVERGDALAAAFEILRALCAHARPSKRGLISALLERVKAEYGTTAHNFDEICELAITLADSAGARRLIRLQQVDRWMEQATDSDGIVRLGELQKASDLARLHGLTERLNGIRKELSRVDVNSLGMSSISVPFEVPRDKLDEYVRQFIVPDDWRETLARFALAGGPPSGVYEENLAAVAEQNARSPEGRPISLPSTPEERAKTDLIHHELFGMSWWGEIGAMILSNAFKPDSVPTEEELSHYFETYFIPKSLAVKIAHAHALYFRGEYDDCVHILVPRVEALVRNLCNAADVPIAREVFGAESGGVAPLGTLLHEFRIERSWSRYLVNALTEPTGMNIRNRVSHGLIGEDGKVEATILIHIVNFLRLLQISESATSPESTP